MQEGRFKFQHSPLHHLKSPPYIFPMAWIPPHRPSNCFIRAEVCWHLWHKQTWRYTAWINLTHKSEVAICLIVHCVHYLPRNKCDLVEVHTHACTHTSDIYNQTIAAAQLLSNTGCASRSIHHNWLSNGISIVSALGRMSCMCLLVTGRLKKNETAVYLHILHMQEWALLCDMKYTCVFLMSDSQISPYNDVSQTMWSLTDVVAAVNLGVASPACSVMVALIGFFLSSLLHSYVIFNYMSATLIRLRETHMWDHLKVWIKDFLFLFFKKGGGEDDHRWTGLWLSLWKQLPVLFWEPTWSPNRPAHPWLSRGNSTETNTLVTHLPHPLLQRNKGR